MIYLKQNHLFIIKDATVMKYPEIRVHLYIHILTQDSDAWCPGFVASCTEERERGPGEVN